MTGRARTDVTTADVVAGGPVVVVAVVATASLAWAHAHHHSLAAVLVTSVLLLAALAFAVTRLAPVRVVADTHGLLAVAGCGVVAAFLFLPGFSYGVADKDPGVYVAHAVEIARTGSYSFVDPATAHPTLPVVDDANGARLPGIWVVDRESGRTVPQFFHLWPALLATAYDIGGYGGLVATTPLLGVVAVMAFAGLLRRAGGVVAAVAGGLLLATCMPEVWQAKYPTSEMLAQALFVGSLLAVAVAARTRWRGAAFAAGLLTGVGFLGRADGWLLVMVASALLAALWVSRRCDGEVVAAASGLAVVLPYALFQAYGPAHAYTVGNHVPDLVPTLLLLAVLVAGAVAARLLLRGVASFVVTLFARPSAQRVAGLAVCAVAFLLLVVGLARPRLFGMTYDGSQRTFDELNVRRLSWFLTLPGLALSGLGVATVALRRWTVAAWAVLLPVLLLAPLFLRKAQVASRLMWWTRRYVPHVVPGLVALAALALAFGVAWRWRGRRVLAPVSVVAFAFLLVSYLGQSLPLRSHDEWHGSFGIGARIAALSGPRRGVYLWEHGPCCTASYELFAAPVWLERGELSVLLPAEPDQLGYVRAYRAAFPGDPLFVVFDGDLSPSLAPLRLELVDEIAGSMPFWEESDDARPNRERRVPYDVRVYRVP